MLVFSKCCRYGRFLSRFFHCWSDCVLASVSDITGSTSIKPMLNKNHLSISTLTKAMRWILIEFIFMISLCSVSLMLIYWCCTSFLSLGIVSHDIFKQWSFSFPYRCWFSSKCVSSLGIMLLDGYHWLLYVNLFIQSIQSSFEQKTHLTDVISLLSTNIRWTILQRINSKL